MGVKPCFLYFVLASQHLHVKVLGHMGCRDDVLREETECRPRAFSFFAGHRESSNVRKLAKHMKSGSPCTRTLFGSERTTLVFAHPSGPCACRGRRNSKLL